MVEETVTPANAAAEAAFATNTEAPILPIAAWRTHFASEAGCEICSIASALQLGAFTLEPDMLRGLAIRLEDLSGVVLSCMGDDGATEDDVADRLLGPAARRQRLQGAPT